MAPQARALESRLEGRLFTEGGRLYFVVEVDRKSGFARVSFRGDNGHEVTQMSISDVGLRIGSNTKVLLDGLSSNDKPNRIIQKPDGCYFATRDGLKGPYLSDTEANEALSSYILSAQSQADSVRPNLSAV